MATFTPAFLALAFLVAVSNAAPKQDINLELPEECKGKGFCTTKPEGYDEMLDLLDSILTPLFVESIQYDMEDRQVVPTEGYSPKEDWHNCPYTNKTEESVYAYSHSNNANLPDFIIQHKLLRQPVQIITCAYDKIEPVGTTEQCFQDLGLSSFNMRSSCETSTANRTLIVFDKKTKKLETKTFPVPCCCTCHVYRTD